MRIIAGQWKGRRIFGSDHLRPTGDRVREALFSILGGTLTGTFLDLYSGTGAVGLEARSRGAHAVLVDREPASIGVVRRNMDVLDVQGGVTVAEVDVLRFLKDPTPHRVRSEPASVVFADPPYDYHSHDKLLRLLGESALVGPDTTIVVERSVRTRVRVPETLELVRETKYGSSLLAFYRRSSEETPDAA